MVQAAVVPANDAALPQAVPAILWKFDGSDTVGTWTRTAAGPRAPLHPLFTAHNRAAEFSSPGDQLIVPHVNAPSFKHGEALTFEFWIAPQELQEKQPVFLLAKGDPDRAGQLDDNLNYGLTVERLTAGTMRVGFCFAAGRGGIRPLETSRHTLRANLHGYLSRLEGIARD